MNYVLGFYFYLLDLIMVEILKFDILVYCVDWVKINIWLEVWYLVGDGKKYIFLVFNFLKFYKFRKNVCL